MPLPSFEAGFTLVEALMAIFILIFGLMAVTNLFLVAGTSNQTANHATAAVTQATETLEALKAIPFKQLTAGGNLDLPYNDASVCAPDCENSPDLCPSFCVVPGKFSYDRSIPGVGRIHTTWVVRNPSSGGTDSLFIVVRAQSNAPVVGGIRSRAEFSTFRTCTSQGC